MSLNRGKLRCAVTFIKYLASVVTLIFLALTLIWNKITFPTQKTLHLAQLVVNKAMNSMYKKKAIFLFLFDLSLLIVEASRTHN